MSPTDTAKAARAPKHRRRPRIVQEAQRGGEAFFDEVRALDELLRTQSELSESQADEVRQLAVDHLRRRLRYWTVWDILGLARRTAVTIAAAGLAVGVWAAVLSGESLPDLLRFL